MKRQEWLTGILAVMLVASLLLAVMAFVAPVVALADGGPGEPEPEVICACCQANFGCMQDGSRTGICRRSNNTWYNCNVVYVCIFDACCGCDGALVGYGCTSTGQSCTPEWGLNTCIK